MRAAQAQAQNTFNNEDLLLDFRNATTPTDNDVTVDLGNVNSFVSAVAGLAGGTVILDNGSGFTATTGAGLPTGFSYAGLTSVLGTPSSGNAIGFSAAAADSTGGTGTLFLTRIQTSASLTPPSPASFQQGSTAQATTAQHIGFIGQETTGTVLGSTVSVLPGSGNNAVEYSSGDAQSYQSEAQDTATHSTIDYAISQSTAASRGGLLEQKQTGAADIYEALWEVPVSGSGSDSYLGYFTFQPGGEVDFTTASAVPEPSTYALLALTGVLGLVFRRQIRSLVA